MFDIDPNESEDILLEKIRKAAIQGTNAPGGSVLNFSIPTLAALLVKLSRSAAETARDAKETANKTLLFTKWLFWATIVLLIVTILLVGLEVVISHKSSSGDPKPNQAQQQAAPKPK